MKNKTVSESMRKHFDNVRKVVTDCQSRINDRITIFADKDARDAKIYNTETLSVMRSQGKLEASSAIKKDKANAIQKVEIEFTEINTVLSDWISQPLPDKATAVLGAYDRYNLTASPEELNILEEITQGNYLAQKVLSGIAKQNGYFDVAFVEMRTLQRDIAEAKSWAISAVRNYAGTITSDNRSMANMFDLDVGVQNDWFVTFAADFYDSTADNPFNRAVAELTELTTAEFDILPRKRSELDAYFDGADQEERIQRAVNLLQSENSSLRDLLPVYDRQLYDDAYSRISESWRESVDNLARQFNQAGKALMSATKQAPIPSVS